MLLQMAFEKIAKAALLRNGQWGVERTQATHRGATHMVNLLANKAYASKTTFSVGTIRHEFLPLVRELEELNPAVARQSGRQGPWLEYPWETPEPRVAVPCEDLPRLDRYGTKHAPKVVLLLRFAGELVRNHAKIFG